MAFNSAALSAGIGSMLQGMQQSAQQKLQLAQMERQQRIENENLAQQRAMEKIALEGAGVDLTQKKAINPLQLRDLTARVDLTEKMSPFQLESAKIGVEGQKLGNRQQLFQLDNINPLLERQQRTATELGEKTLPFNVKLAEQSVQGNQFNFLDRAKARYQGALAGMKTAAGILNNKQATAADKALAYKEYNVNQGIIRGVMGDVDSMSNLSSLFGDRASIMSGIRSTLGVPPTVTDDQLATYLQSIAPDMAAPDPRTGVERFQQIGNLVQNAMSPLALNPESRFVDYIPPTLKGTTIIGGDKPAALNKIKLAEAALPTFLSNMQSAKELGLDAKTVWNSLGSFGDKDFTATGDLNIQDPKVRTRALKALADRFIAPEKLQESLSNYSRNAEDKLKGQIQIAIANMNKNLGEKGYDAQLKAAMATTSMPLVNVWTSAYTKAGDELITLAKQMRDVIGFDIKTDLPAAFMSKIKTIRDQAVKKQLQAAYDRYGKVQKALQNSLTKFVADGDTDMVRISKSLQAFAAVGISPDQGALSASGLVGAPAPASGGSTNSNIGIPGFDGRGFDAIKLQGGGPAPR